MTDLAAQLEQKTAQLAAVREISRAIAEARDLDETLALITHRTTDVMQVDSCSLYLYDATGERLILAATSGLNKNSVGEAYLPRGAGLTGLAAERRQTIASLNAQSDDRFYPVVGSGEGKFPSLMAMPLMSRGNVIGAAHVQTARPHQFTADEIELFGFVTNLAGTALEKAQLVHKALIQEMHHRVKNNLQMIAMLLRLQMEQADKLTPEAVLNETINRVLSIATVHEVLSETGVDKVGILDLIKRVSAVIEGNMVSPDCNIRVEVSGENVELPSQRATSLALVANELLQNALEHGMANRKEGHVTMVLTNGNQQLKLNVFDDGNGLPPDFNPQTDLGLGLDIVRTTITEDMQGQFTISPREDATGTRVDIMVPLGV